MRLLALALTMGGCHDDLRSQRADGCDRLAATGFPMTGLWVLGMLLGIDLLSHGIGWLTLAWRPAAATA